MEVRRYDDAAAWLERATPLLLADEPRHNLLFGIADTLIRRPETYPVHHLWLALEEGAPAGAMLQTPPYPVAFARPASERAAEALVEAAIEDLEQVPGVSGAVPEAEAFAGSWAERTGGTWHRRTAMGVYACRSVRPVASADGSDRIAGPGDLDALLPLVDAFAVEVLPEAVRDHGRNEATLRGRLGDDPRLGGFWVREIDGAIVSISGHSGRTPTGIRIGPVYTPPEHRGRGYATALVHAQTSWLLADAVSCCFLFTDLANDTSNGVYRRIGYEQVCEAAEIVFTPA